MKKMGEGMASECGQNMSQIRVGFSLSYTPNPCICAASVPPIPHSRFDINPRSSFVNDEVKGNKREMCVDQLGRAEKQENIRNVS